MNPGGPAEPVSTAGDDLLSTITTTVYDPLHDDVLLRVPGVMPLPPGTVVELPGGRMARVASLRLDATHLAAPHLVVNVVQRHQDP